MGNCCFWNGTHFLKLQGEHYHQHNMAKNNCQVWMYHHFVELSTFVVSGTYY
jgi:hypothetical protein